MSEAKTNMFFNKTKKRPTWLRRMESAVGSLYSYHLQRSYYMRNSYKDKSSIAETAIKCKDYRI